MAGKPRLVGMNHVALEVHDVDEELEFLGAIFELRLRGRGGRMAFVDMGDQFLALSTGRTQARDGHRHLGLVVEDPGAVLERARAAGAEVRGNEFYDPSGNRFQVVAYADVQFTKAREILQGMGLGELEKSESALQELRDAGLLS